MTTQVLFFKKDPHLNAIEFYPTDFPYVFWLENERRKIYISLLASGQLIEVTGMIMAV